MAIALFWPILTPTRRVGVNSIFVAVIDTNELVAIDTAIGKSVAGDRVQTVHFALADFDESCLLCKDAHYGAAQRVLLSLVVSFGRYWQKRTLLINIHIERVPAT